ncbi:hypothetical protein PLUTE_a2806 [Pseudoalteromonas luteoviolacea DSM 6061]|nr:hypothetical protein [Pseudoalteromonas luteoviolacea DSM 6061]
MPFFVLWQLNVVSLSVPIKYWQLDKCKADQGKPRPSNIKQN